MAFDLLIVDVMMPGETGLELTKSVRAQSQVPILMLTARGEPEDRIAGLEHGADDYLPKPFEPRELVLRCGALMRRAAPPPALPLRKLKMGDAVFDPERGELRRKGKPVRLTGSEAALLKLFAANAGRTFSRSDLCIAAGRDAGALHRRAGDAAEAQDRGRPQAAALYPDRARRGLCARPRPGGIGPCGTPSAR